MHESKEQSDAVEASYLDLDERRRRALAEIDNAKFGWFHIRACLVAGVGFFTDAYDLFAINLVSLMIGYVYYADNGNAVPANIDLGIKVAASIGTFIGQIGFGWLADVLGRKKMYGVELMIIIVATLGQAVAASSRAVSVAGLLMFWRVLVGIGIGGDYPLSAVITSEFATTSKRGAMMAAVFAMQGFGSLTTGIVTLITLAGFKSAVESDIQYLDYVWRIVIGFGCIPALVAVYFRLTIPETPRYTMDVEQNIHKAANDVATVLNKDKNDEFQAVPIKTENKASWSDFVAYFSQWSNLKILIGTSVTWFALDVAFYGIGLNNGIIINRIGFGSPVTSFDKVWNAAVGQVIITLLGSVPGYWFTVFLVEKMGRIKIQLLGFAMSVILFAILGFAFNPILETSVAIFIVLFTLTQFFQNFGPNSTTFIIPGEVFPTRYRSTGHGISAASGKLGAIVAQVGFSRLKDIGGKDAWVPHLLQIFSLFMLIGLLFTFLVPETKGKTLEELSNEPDYKVSAKTQN